MFDYFLGAAPQFLLYFAVTLGLLAAFVATYSAVTPPKEIALIRAGNPAASISLIGAVLGFVIPLGVIVQHSVSIPDLLLWGLVVLIVQSVTYFVSRLVIPDLCNKITEGNIASGVWAGGIALAVGLLNASCMVP
jgi:putative membrane protein